MKLKFFKKTQAVIIGAVMAFSSLYTGFSKNVIDVHAAFEAPYYNITQNGGKWDGKHYTLGGEVIKDAFFCDGTYTYFLQADGSAMKNRLTYHPDGEHVIYFDEYGQ